MSPSRVSLAVGVLAVSLSTAPAFAAGRPTEWSLPSGLTILHQPDPRFPIVRVLVTVGGGTADAAPGQRPLAHLAEHVAFRTPLAGGPAFQTLRAAGCDITGFTELDTTTFGVSCPTDAAPLAVGFAAALATHDLHFTEAEVKAESHIVLAETTQRSDAGGRRRTSSWPACSPATTPTTSRSGSPRTCWRSPAAMYSGSSTPTMCRRRW